MKTLITGATGFLGSHLVRLLCKQGKSDDVRVLARKAPAWLEDLGVEVVSGSIVDEASVVRACKGVVRIYHLAGMVSRDPDDGHEMQQVHVTGTRLLCRAAKDAGSKRMVLVSTSGTVAVSEDPDRMPDEDSPAPLDLIGRWPYYASKHYQEEAAIRGCGDKVELVRVNPSLLLGPGDDRLSSTSDVLNFLAREIPVVPAGGINFVDVRDVADALPLAMDKGQSGRRYLMGGYNLTLREFFGRLSRISKVPAPLLTTPDKWRRFPYVASRVQSTLLKVVGRTARVRPEAVQMGEYYWYFNSDRARNELGFQAREATATLFDTIEYLREHFLGQNRA